MKILTRVIIITTLLILFNSTITANDDFMEVDLVKPGMKGYGKTVFSGTKIETFSVTIVSVLKDFSPGYDIILADLSDNETISKTGVVSGMSGSPVYIDGKLIGAVAYSWPFSTEATAGITPIHEMLKLKDQYNEWQDSDINDGGFFGYSDTGDRNLRYIKTPVTMTGFNEYGFNEFKKEFEGFGFIPVQSGGVGLKNIRISTLEPGSAVSVQLVRGAMDISAVGTVTYVDGNDVYAFGHPMISGGNIRIPMATAYIHKTFPSIYSSFKMGTSVTTIGEIVQDRTPGVYGIIGKEHDFVKLNIMINDHDYKAEIINNKFFLGSLLRTVILNVLMSEAREIGDVTINYEIKLFSKQRELIEYRDMMTGVSLYDTLFGLGRMVRVFTYIKNNPEREIPITGINVKMKLKETSKQYILTKVNINKTSYTVGEEVKLNLSLKQIQHPEIKKDLTFEIPSNTPPGNYYLLISDTQNEDKQRLIESPNYIYLDSMDEIRSWMDGSIPVNGLSIRLIRGELGLSIENIEFNDLPPTFFVLQQSDPSTTGNITNVHTIKRDVILLDAPVMGVQQFLISIKRK